VPVCLADGIVLIFRENNTYFAVRRTFKEAFITEALVESLAFFQVHRSLKPCSFIECKSSQIDPLNRYFSIYFFKIMI